VNGPLPIPNRVSDLELPNDEQIMDLRFLEWNTNPNVVAKNNDVTKTITVSLRSVNSTILDLDNGSVQLNNPFVFVVPKRSVMKVNQATCSFFNTSKDTWDSRGCLLNRSFLMADVAYYECVCNHLTDFSVLGDEMLQVITQSNIKTLANPSAILSYNLFESTTFWLILGAGITTLALILWSFNLDLTHNKADTTVSTMRRHFIEIFSSRVNTRKVHATSSRDTSTERPFENKAKIAPTRKKKRSDLFITLASDFFKYIKVSSHKLDLISRRIIALDLSSSIRNSLPL
jgi:hypothetical protein